MINPFVYIKDLGSRVFTKLKVTTSQSPFSSCHIVYIGAVKDSGSMTYVLRYVLYLTKGSIKN